MHWAFRVTNHIYVSVIISVTKWRKRNCCHVITLSETKLTTNRSEADEEFIQPNHQKLRASKPRGRSLRVKIAHFVRTNQVTRCLTNSTAALECANKRRHCGPNVWRESIIQGAMTCDNNGVNTHFPCPSSGLCVGVQDGWSLCCFSQLPTVGWNGQGFVTKPCVN